MTYTVHLLHSAGRREEVHSGTPQTAASAFFEHIARGSIDALADGQRRIRAPYTVRILGPDRREVAHGRDLSAFDRPWEFIGYSESARLLGLLRALPVTATALLGDRESRMLNRNAAEGRALTRELAAHIRSRLSAAQGMIVFAGERVERATMAEG